MTGIPVYLWLLIAAVVVVLLAWAFSLQRKRDTKPADFPPGALKPWDKSK